jgi:nitrogen fixation/metabolism regulation signal transduction histidine kinase
LFLAATLVPLCATLWITTSLLDRSLSYASTDELDRLSRTLQRAGRELYQLARESLKSDAADRRIKPRRLTEAEIRNSTAGIQEFWASGDPERFLLSGKEGNQLDYLVRHHNELWIYSAPLGAVGMQRLSEEYTEAREQVQAAQERDLRRGLTYTFMVLAAGVWLVSLAALVFMTHRLSRPILQLTSGLSQLASGNFEARLETRRRDEIGRAIRAFNETAEQLERNRNRLVYLTQIASWQLLARKMAHELKNSLTPIRLTVEEMLARYGDNDRAFVEQGAQIIVDEVEALERRVRAFSEFSAEPPVRPSPLNVNALLEERIAFLKSAHPEIAYSCRLAASLPMAFADEDLLKGILTNLLENAAEAAGAGGTVLATTAAVSGRVAVEVHDSGPGLSEEARKSLFEPTISFKKRGMGLGLSIARKSALLSGGDILLVKGELTGAAFRVVLPQSS